MSNMGDSATGVNVRVALPAELVGEGLGLVAGEGEGSESPSLVFTTYDGDKFIIEGTLPELKALVKAADAAIRDAERFETFAALRSGPLRARHATLSDAYAHLVSVAAGPLVDVFEHFANMGDAAPSSLAVQHETNDGVLSFSVEPV